MRIFHTASDEDIKIGGTADVYFAWTEQILKANGLDEVEVVAEVTSGKLPNEWSWAVLCGIEEEARLFQGFPVNVKAIPEGTIFRSKDYYGTRMPVMIVEGRYTSFSRLETPLLGLICQASGIATASARIRKLASDKLVLNFGARRMHPCLSPLIADRLI